MKKIIALSSVFFSSLCLSASSLYPASTSGSIAREKIDNNSFFWGNNNNSGTIKFEIDVDQTGVYMLEANVIAKDGNSNSFFIDLDSLPSNFEWHIPHTQTPKWMPAGNFFLQEGTQDITFYVRESETKIADIRISLIAENSLDEMPEGVPDTTMRRNDCYLEGEKDFFEESLERTEVSGCPASIASIVTPETEVRSYRPYAYNTSGTVFQCDRVRKNYLYSEGLNIYSRELSELVNSTERDPYGNNVHCAVNNYWLWARENAMSEISASGQPGQSEFDRMMAVDAIASSYFANPQIQERAANQAVGNSNKHERIVEWLEGLAEQISREIDDRENDESYTTNSNIWRAYGVSLVGLLSKNQELVSKAEKVFIEVMRTVSGNNPITEYDKGFLPQELARKQRAIHYQAYALMPIIGMSLASESYGCNYLKSKWRNNQVLRLSRKTIEGYIEPDVFVNAVEDYTGEHHEQIKGTDPKDALILIKALDNESIYSDIQSFVKEHTPENVIVEGRDNSYVNFGGSTERFRKTVSDLKNEEVTDLCQ